MGAEAPLVAAQANEANTATDETPAKAVPLRALRLAFLSQEGGKRDEAKAKNYQSPGCCLAPAHSIASVDHTSSNWCIAGET
jgi:hypothetical protein